MFGGMLDKVTGILDQRLVLTSLLPAIAFWAAVAGLAGSQMGWQHVETRWNHLDGTAKILLAVVAVGVLVLFALILSVSEGALLGLYEGYWGSRGPSGWLAAAGKRWHKRRRRLKGADYEFIYMNYPRDRNLNAPGAANRPEYMMPTSLGNIIKAAELYPGDEGRYGIDAVFFWPRLYQIIPDNARSSLIDARTSLALMLNICTLALGLAAGTLIALAATTIKPAAAFWATAASAAVVAWLAYRSALGPARVYGELVRAMYDLYRGDLLAKLGFALPGTLAGERELWKNLGLQMYRRAPDSQPCLMPPGVKLSVRQQGQPQQQGTQRRLETGMFHKLARTVRHHKADTIERPSRIPCFSRAGGVSDSGTRLLVEREHGRSSDLSESTLAGDQPTKVTHPRYWTLVLSRAR